MQLLRDLEPLMTWDYKVCDLSVTPEANHLFTSRQREYIHY